MTSRRIASEESHLTDAGVDETPWPIARARSLLLTRKAIQPGGLRRSGGQDDIDDGSGPVICRGTPAPPPAQTQGLDIELDEVTFISGRERQRPDHRPLMPVWRASLFAFVAHNTVGPAANFGIPPDRVLEIRARIAV